MPETSFSGTFKMTGGSLLLENSRAGESDSPVKFSSVSVRMHPNSPIHQLTAEAFEKEIVRGFLQISPSITL